MRDRLRNMQKGSITDIKQRLGISDCLKCNQLTSILKKSLHYLSQIKPQLTNSVMTSKIEKLFLKSFKILEGKPFISTDNDIDTNKNHYE